MRLWTAKPKMKKEEWLQYIPQLKRLQQFMAAVTLCRQLMATSVKVDEHRRLCEAYRAIRKEGESLIYRVLEDKETWDPYDH